MSLQAVAAATGLSVSFLSLVENDKSDITIGRLARLAKFYGVHLGELLPPPGDPVVVRREELKRVESPSEGIDVFLLAPDARGTMLPLIAEFHRGGRLAEWAEHEGEEYVYVLEGEILLELEGREPVVLRAGDGAYYRADRRHTFTAVGDGPTRVFAVASPPHL
jgi:mannose-6-phosphate isomerase-like protein (cupin superfamily)